jgi:predicted transcriptional regulator
MGKPYANDLRIVAVRLIEEAHTRPEVAELCGISLSSVGRFIKRYRSTGSISPAKFGGYKGYALTQYAEQIKRFASLLLALTTQKPPVFARPCDTSRLPSVLRIWAKGAATDMPDLTPPRHIPTLP